MLVMAELRHAIYASGKRIRFQSQLGQTKFFFDKQGKNAQQCISFHEEFSYSKMKTHASKILKQRL